MVHVKFLREMRLLSLQYALIKPFEITRKRERQNEERNTYINIFCCQCQSKLESRGDFFFFFFLTNEQKLEKKNSFLLKNSLKNLEFQLQKCNNEITRK